MSRIQFGTLSRPAFPPKRSGRPERSRRQTLPSRRGLSFPLPWNRACPRGIRNTQVYPSPFGV